MRPIDSSVEAEFEDGFILSETETNDTSRFEDGRNTFYDIQNRLHEKAHGKMVRFSVYWKNRRYDVDWTALPDNARPIRFKDMFHSWHPNGSETHGISTLHFGYQYTSKNKNFKEILDLS